MKSRIEKFRAKLSGDIRKQRYDSQKKQMVELETAASADLEKIENEVKQIVQGRPALHLPYFLIFSKEVYSRMQRFDAATLTTELTILFNKWAKRGLNFIFMREIARRYSKPALDLYSVCPIPGLVGHWTFFTGSGAKAWDLSGYGNHGTSPTFPTWTAGKIGRGLLFDGIDDSVNCGAGASLNITNAITLAAWVKTSTWGPGWRGIVYKSITTDGTPWALRVDNNNRVYFTINPVGGVSTINLMSTSIVIDGNWHYVIGTYNGSVGKLYVDGDLKVTSSVNIFEINPTGNVYIGGGTTAKFNGTIDEVMVFNRALSPAEIKKIYDTTK